METSKSSSGSLPFLVAASVLSCSGALPPSIGFSFGAVPLGRVVNVSQNESNLLGHSSKLYIISQFPLHLKSYAPVSKTLSSLPSWALVEMGIPYASTICQIELRGRMAHSPWMQAGVSP